jgi:hypothetical protein
MDLRRYEKTRTPKPRWRRRKLGGGQTLSREILTLAGPEVKPLD